jgi:probable rRNA maturation factor
MREGEKSPPGSAGSEVLGDVIVSIDTARRQAARHKKTLPAELRMLLAHGLLHLLGYDHQTDEEERRMTALTAELCRAAEPENARAPSPAARRKPARAPSGAKPRGAKNRPVRS